jgi:ubiquinone/menaquinone biosynthesis C-methylase UbiE
MDLAAHKELLRKQFAVQARVHPKTLKLRHSENVVPMLELAKPEKTDRVLDVACGWGYVALTFAPHVRAVLGVDLTPEMVALALSVAHDKKVKNVEYIEGDVEELQFPAGSFEIVTCRFTFHHFARPDRALREMTRVLAPGGRIILYDTVAAAEVDKAALHNAIEFARDPSHVKMYRDTEFQELFKAAGLQVKGRVTTLMKRHLGHWMAFVDADEAHVRRVKTLMLSAVEGNAAGLGIRERGGDLQFTHTCVAWRLEPG